MEKPYLNYSIGSDTYAYEVTRATPSGKTVWAKQMDVKHKEGAPPMSQTWEYSSSDFHEEEKFTKRKFGGYKPVGTKCGFGRLSETPYYHYDYSF